MTFEMFRKSAADKYLRTDAPGAILTILPPTTVALFGLQAVVLAALALVAIFGHADVVAEGRGVLHENEPSIAVHAPFSGRLLSIRTVHQSGHEGESLLTMDARAEEAEHSTCVAALSVDQHELDGLLSRLGDWDAPALHDRDAAMALVLITQVRAQREKLTAAQERCDLLGARVLASKVSFPVDATVADVAVSVGAQVREGDLILTLVPATAHLVGYVALREADRNALSVGQSVRLKLDAVPFDEAGAGRARVSQLLETLPSFVKLDAPEGSGAFAEVAIQAMPSPAVRPRAGMTFTADVMTRRATILSLLFGIE